MSPSRLFGTDGVRGVFGVEPLDRATVTALGVEIGRTLDRSSAAGDPSTVVIGGDTRDSTPTLSAWLATGLAAAGCRIRNTGTLPTPGVAWSTTTLGAAAGIAVSASHNLHPDNGIKLLDRDGFKWSPAAERSLETRLQDRELTTLPENAEALPAAEGELADRYLDALAAIAAFRLDGMRIALDTAHGAAAGLAPRLFARLGAEVVSLGDAPDGTNINRDRGSTHPQALARQVLASECDLGFAFDGDADRVVPVDAAGRIWDGDALLYLLAEELVSRGELTPPRIVATSMSNLGLEVALAEHDVQVERCDVGDRVVVETLRREGLRLGGEQAGHIIDLEYATGGDGMLTALQVAGVVARRGQSLAELLTGFRSFPQILRNVAVREKPAFDTLPAVTRVADDVERQLGKRGRLVLRYSGTEPLARVMIEGPDAAEVERLAGGLADAIAREIGG